MDVTVTAWNVQEFGKKTLSAAALRQRVKGVAEHIRSTDPHIFGILEVEKIDVLELIEGEFPDFDFGFTEGRDSNNKPNKEILVGWKRGVLDQVTFSQKRQFNLNNPFLRPGALLSFRKADNWYNVLFLHTDSGTEARDFGNRYEMFDKVWNLRKALDKKVGGNKRERLVVVGDLNTMGLQFPTRRKADLVVSGPGEIEALEKFAEKQMMTRLQKSHDVTWKKFGKNWTSDLDHVIASDIADFKTLGNRSSDGEPFTVQVSGWVDNTAVKREKFIEKLSDHSSLTFTIEV